MTSRSPAPYGLHWFRRDLRVAGNPALQHHWERHSGRVVGVFFFDSKFLARKDFSFNRFGLFLETLRELREEMQERGGELLVIDGDAATTWPRLLANLKTKPSSISFNRDYEPYARARDERVRQWAQNEGLQILEDRDHLLIEPHELTKDDGGYYQVFTPFARRWYERFHTPEIQARIEFEKQGLASLKARDKGKPLDKIFHLSWKELKAPGFEFKDALEEFIRENQKHVTVPLPDAGSRAAFARLNGFKKELDEYASARDIPSVDGTSKMSLYLKNGSITTSLIIPHLNLGHGAFRAETGENRFLKELVWREFYYSILWHVPRVEHEAFNEKYKDLRWANKREWFERWCEGTTGYPIVDAGMRQLNTTGWMHNRVRMIVASFLCKDLLIDWRWGENYFMQKLLDGDLAPNNGGWQWAASTGCDPQPYFRIFNPELQSRKFDPDGEYIRTYVKELRGVQGKAIHAPEGAKGYPKPIVEHSTQRSKALALYKSD
ncbi:MAG: deoxyribodipyrimidine photo-lyase [Bdellovibrionaceae bacterium]|nr:deoxyribodipyrimidine photo-lyase [Pseudobdellovibrionaceae bacterium]